MFDVRRGDQLTVQRHPQILHLFRFHHRSLPEFQSRKRPAWSSTDEPHGLGLLWRHLQAMVLNPLGRRFHGRVRFLLQAGVLPHFENNLQIVRMGRRPQSFGPPP